MLKTISLWVLIVSLVICTFLAILSIWGVLDSDVSGKSIATLGVVAFSSLITLAVSKAMDDKGKVQ